MAKTKQPTVDELLAQIESLKNELALEKKINRKILDLPEDAPAEDMPAKIRWSTEWMQNETDLHEVTDGAVTDVYDQKVFKLIRLKNGHVYINQHNGKEVGKILQPYKQLKIKLSEGSFFMLLELMQFAAKEFDNNQEEVVAKLTGGKGIKIRRAINAL
ncbi:hypothetical protein [Spirosoma foliorum]|uniref:Uncharacterized protein n=1 Tax=Spirosoma foliorum TaxID=2710596 RepID=A0A7G5GTU4_9BACT|nr:hypothetical protein [Spirosoma foliorum]QMW02286.1 hypothetical protein H3H32_30915 [Spirosoma foliorum]